MFVKSLENLKSRQPGSYHSDKSQDGPNGPLLVVKGVRKKSNCSISSLAIKIKYGSFWNQDLLADIEYRTGSKQAKWTTK